MGRLTARRMMRNRRINRTDYYDRLLSRLQYELQNESDPDQELLDREQELKTFLESNADADIGKVTWNDGDAEGSTRNIALPPDMNVLDDTVYQVLVHNTAPVAVTVEVEVQWTDIDGNARQSPLTSFDVEAESGKVQLVQAALLGEGCVLQLTSGGAVSGASYETYVEIRKV